MDNSGSDMIISHGTFSLYPAPAKHKYAKGSLFCKNENDQDWYDEFARVEVKKEDVLFVMVQGDMVCSVSNDPETMFPAGYKVFETDQTDVQMGWRLEGEEFKPPLPVGPPT